MSQNAYPPLSVAETPVDAVAAPRYDGAAMGTISLDSTRRLHEQLIARWKSDPGALAAVCADANRALAERGIKFEQGRDLAVAISALLLDEAAVARLRQVTETLHGLVERAMDWLVADPKRLDRYFADHRRMFPYLCKTPGLDTWQGFSRYDAVVTPEGGIKIIELNTGCPAGFLHADDFSLVTRDAIQSLEMAGDLRISGFGTIAPGVLIEELLAVEAAAGVEPGLIALVNDENNLLNELQLIADALAARGRSAAVVPAAEIECRDGRSWWRGEPISLTLNKIRISTENSPGWNWKAGFRDRYAGFLATIQEGTAASVNNLAALIISEDKGLLAVLLADEFQAELSPPEREILAEHVLWTARMKEGQVRRRGETIDLLPYVRQHREQFVIKPANEGRGFRVVIGKYCTDQEWQDACRIDEDLPCVVQDYAELASLPVLDPRGDEAAVSDMFLTVGLAVIRGRYHGLLSRVSANPVNNVGLKGIIQAVLTAESS